ncbi:MAG: hypothetical protein Q7U75_04060, partial [Desulfobacterales bacterium]|nr:hypothetical protein [Desulfobacterales bacterium]
MDYVRDRYTPERAAQVMTFGYERPKGSIKDMARVLGYPAQLADSITKTISEDLKATIQSELDIGGEFSRMYNGSPDAKRIVDAARKVEGLVRGDSIHASAFVISPFPIADRMPMQTPKGQQGTLSAEDTASFIIQFDGKTVDKLGYLKMDFLGLGNLDAISNTQRLVKKIYGKDIELEDIPFDDRKTLAMLRRGETAGLFQVESEGMTKTLKEVAPTKFSEISDIIALYRPGPMDYIPVYIEGKRNPESIQYLDPRLEPILEETYGVACIAEGSMVATSAGEKAIETVEPGETVLTEDGSYQKCLARWPKGVQDTVVVRTDFGEELVCTPDHKVLTQLGWVEAGELTTRHLIKAFNPAITPRAQESFDWEDWLVGLFLADGYSSKTGSPNIACCSEEFAYQVKAVVEECLPIMTGVSVYSSSNGLGTTWYVRLAQRAGNNGYFRADHKPHAFNELLKRHGLYRVAGQGKTWPSDYSISTVIGFMEGDGCYINRRVNLKYEHIARGLYDALLSYGIRASLFRRDESAWSVSFDYDPAFIAPRFRSYDGRPSRGYYVPKEHLRPYGSSMSCLDRKNNLGGKKGEIPYVSVRAARRMGWSESDGSHPLWGRVLSVKPGPSRPVYDLSVEKNHSFVVGGLVVSNCYQEQLMEIAKSLAG